MANINATQEVTIWGDDGVTYASVGNITTDANGLDTLPLGVYFSSDPTLIDTNVYPLRVSASGNLLTESAVHATDLDIRDLDESQDDVRIYSASGTPEHQVYFTEPQDTVLVDPDGHYVNVNSEGSMQVTFATGGSSLTRMIELRYEKNFPLETVDVWENVQSYIVPSGYNLELIDFSSSAENNTSSARAMTNVEMGTYDISTTTFTDGDDYATPYFGSTIECHVHVATVGSTDITITYTNTNGTTGRTGTVTIPTLSIVGQSFPVVLEGTDIGVTDVTNVTAVGGTSGELHIHGVVTIFEELMTNSYQTYHQITSRESIILGQNEILELSVRSGQKAAVERYIHVLGQLRSIVED